MSFSYFLSEEAKSHGLLFVPPRDGDAGFDLPSLGDQEIPPRSFGLLRTGVHLAIPIGWVGLIRDRSSVALRGGTCTAGVIDASYRGEVKVAMHNLSDKPLVFRSGDRIAQCVILQHYVPEMIPLEAATLDDLGVTGRGTSGFGSTGM